MPKIRLKSAAGCRESRALYDCFGIVWMHELKAHRGEDVVGSMLAMGRHSQCIHCDQ